MLFLHIYFSIFFRERITPSRSCSSSWWAPLDCCLFTAHKNFKMRNMLSTNRKYDLDLDRFVTVDGTSCDCGASRLGLPESSFSKNLLHLGINVIFIRYSDSFYCQVCLIFNTKQQQQFSHVLFSFVSFCTNPDKLSPQTVSSSWK